MLDVWNLCGCMEREQCVNEWKWDISGCWTGNVIMGHVRLLDSSAGLCKAYATVAVRNYAIIPIESLRAKMRGYYKEAIYLVSI